MEEISGGVFGIVVMLFVLLLIGVFIMTMVALPSYARSISNGIKTLDDQEEDLALVDRLS